MFIVFSFETRSKALKLVFQTVLYQHIELLFNVTLNVIQITSFPMGVTIWTPQVHPLQALNLRV